MTTDQAWRLLSNNAVPEQPRVAGDPEAVQALLSTRAIIGTPK